MKTRLVLLLIPLALGSCADNNASVRLAAVCAPPDDPAKCAFGATCGAETIGQIFMDKAETNFLWTFVQVDNQRTDNKNLDVSRLTTSTAWVQEAVIEYTGANLPKVTYPILGSAEVPPAGSAVISILPIPESVGDYVQAVGTALGVPSGGFVDVIAKIKLRGVYGDTSTFETGEFDMPIRVCDGCAAPDPVCAGTADFVVHCPGNFGQGPIAAKCVTP